MNLFHLLQDRAEAGRHVRAGLIGAGKFGSMFLSQVPSTPGLDVPVIADLSPDRARTACATVGWDDMRIAATQFMDAGANLIADPAVEVVIEATRHPAAGLAHALAALEHGKHIVMVNVEADVLAGPVLANRFRAAGLVYSMAYGDQPALASEMVDWARAAGFSQYGLRTDETGQHAAMYKPFHLTGMELGISVLSAALRGEPTGQARAWNADTVAVAKRDLAPGEVLDGEGGFTVWGRLMPARDSAAMRVLPIGLADGVAVTRAVRRGEVLTQDDLALDPADPAVRLRGEMAAAFGS